jgi:hypothetical protein
MASSIKFLSGVVVAATLVAAVPHPARADWDSDHDSSGERNRWKDLRFEGDVGFLIGGMGIGKLGGFAGGMEASLGIRRDRLAVFGSYDLLSVGDSPSTSTTDPSAPPPVRGFMQRVGADVRYSVGRFGGSDDSSAVRGDLWLSLGAGGEVIQWYDGGKLHRRDLSFGFGGQATFRIGHDSHARYLGFHYALKALLANAPGMKNQDPVCAGPCDEPTPPVPFDAGVFFHFGVVFGK